MTTVTGLTRVRVIEVDVLPLSDVTEMVRTAETFSVALVSRLFVQVTE